MITFSDIFIFTDNKRNDSTLHYCEMDVPSRFRARMKNVEGEKINTIQEKWQSFYGKRMKMR